jgi:hypothetical protein
MAGRGKAVGLEVYTPLSRNENEPIGEFRRNKIEQSYLPTFTKLRMLQSKQEDDYSRVEE